MNRTLLIAADLSEPPSEPLVFRDVTLYAKVFKKMDIIAVSPQEMIDYYAKWFRKYGLMDFVDDLQPPGKVEGILEIESGKLTSFNYQQVISIISNIR